MLACSGAACCEPAAKERIDQLYLLCSSSLSFSLPATVSLYLYLWLYRMIQLPRIAVCQLLETHVSAKRNKRNNRRICSGIHLNCQVPT